MITLPTSPLREELLSRVHLVSHPAQGEAPLADTNTKAAQTKKVQMSNKTHAAMQRSTARVQ